MKKKDSLCWQAKNLPIQSSDHKKATLRSIFKPDCFEVINLSYFYSMIIRSDEFFTKLLWPKIRNNCNQIERKEDMKMKI